MSHTESVIVDVTQFDDWFKQYGRPVIPPDKRPTIIQSDRETAEQEAVRLAKAHPGHRFAVFTLVGLVETKEVPTHITLGGRIAAVTSKPVWSERDL